MKQIIVIKNIILMRIFWEHVLKFHCGVCLQLFLQARQVDSPRLNIWTCWMWSVRFIQRGLSSFIERDLELLPFICRAENTAYAHVSRRVTTVTVQNVVQCTMYYSQNLRLQFHAVFSRIPHLCKHTQGSFPNHIFEITSVLLNFPFYFKI